MQNKENPSKKQLLVPDEQTQSECDLELGEYLLHVYVQESQGLRLDAPIKGLLSLDAFGQNHISKVHDNILPQAKSYWGEHFFVNHTFSSRSELENASFVLSVLDHNVVFKNSKIGSMAMSCTKIISSENSTIFNQWSILTNSEKEVFSPMGFIKFSVNFVRAGNPRTNLEQSFNPMEQSQALENLNIPPEIVLKQKQITVSLFRGERIIRMDSVGGGADPYIKLNMGGLKLKSNYISDSQNPVFGEKMMVPAIFPTVVESLLLKFKDHDNMGKNDYIGCRSFRLDQIVNGDFIEPRWHHFYGARPDAKFEKFRDQMNQVPEIASTFKGSLLMSLKISDCPSPSFGIKKMTSAEFQVAQDTLVDVEFSVSVFLEYVQNFNSNSTKPHVACLSWSDKEIRSKNLNYNRGVLIIHQELNLSQTFGIPKYLMDEYDICPSDELSERILACVPDLILTCMVGDKHNIFYRLKAKNYLIKRAGESQSEEIKMHADHSISELQENMSGIIRFKASCGMSSQFEGHSLFWRTPSWPKQVQFKPVRIICYLFQGKNLMSSDSNGSSDPLVQFYNLGTTAQSAVFPKTLNPIWNQRLVMSSWLVNNSIPSMIINTWDKDLDWKGKLVPEFLGYTFVTLTGDMIMTEGFDRIPSPTWYDLCFSKQHKAGKMLMSFQVVPDSHVNEFDQFLKSYKRFNKIPVPRTLHHIKINALGLRGLESTGLFPVKNASLKFATSCLKSVESMGGGAMFTDLEAMAKSSGNNPSIGSVLSISADIPQDIKVMPVISCSALENGLKLFGTKQIIGTFSINLGMFTLVTLQNLSKRLRLLNERYKREGALTTTEEIDNLVSYIEAKIRNLGGKVETQKRADQEEDDEDEDEALKNVQTLGEEMFQTLGGDDEQEDEEEEWKETTNQNQLLSVMKKTVDTGTIYTVHNQHAIQKVRLEQEFMQEFNLIQKNKEVAVRSKAITFEDEAYGLEEEFEEEEEEEEVKMGALFSGINFNKKMAEGVKKIQFKLAKETQIIIEAKDHELENNSAKISGYIELGYATVDHNNKHFRKYHPGELEGSEYMGKEKFFTLDICRGKRVNFKRESIFERIFSSEEEHFKQVGKFKGNIEVISDELLQKLGDLSIPRQVLDEYQLPYELDKFKYSNVDREILKGVKVLIRIYVVDALFNWSQDFQSENDSYIRVEMDGHQTQESRKIKNNNQPKFFSTFQMEHTLPGASDIRIKFFDSDPLKADEFIGETVIDIEQRFFDRQWRSFKEHPIESRNIYHPSSAIDVGVCRLFVEAYDMSQIVPPLRMINPRPSTKVEVRVVVWSVWGVSSQDFEDVSDLYVKGSLPAFDMAMCTDTHYRAQAGFGSFNWRMKFSIDIDEYFNEEKADLMMMVYDKDFLSSNDFVASTSVNLKEIVEQCLYFRKKQSIMGEDENQKESSKFVKKMVPKFSQKEEGEEQKPVFIKLSVDCVTIEEAETSPVGIGRGDPNQSPYLEEPVGRFKWTMNPFLLMEQLVGPQFKNKMWMIFCGLFLIITIFLTIPIFFSETLASLFESLLGIK